MLVELSVEVVLKDEIGIVLGGRILENHQATEVQLLQIGERQVGMLPWWLKILNLFEEPFQACQLCRIDPGDKGQDCLHSIYPLPESNSKIMRSGNGPS